MAVLHHSLKNLLQLKIRDGSLEQLEWKDFGTGVSMARLARQDQRELVLYRVTSDAKPDAFLPHEHIGGEFYLVLKGAVEDETGLYREGDIVYLDPRSIHTPRAVGEAVILVLWPAGVRIVKA
ncbi:MAG: hypothetical protein GTO40_24665 [Deltaproteobacteria bacterium]|nr:hypothetical protein [Deltaproteobacteria bacterium]